MLPAASATYGALLPKPCSQPHRFMSANLDSNLRQRVLTLIAYSSNGITAQELAAGVTLKADDGKLKQCLAELVVSGRIVSDGSANPRYIALGDVLGDIAAANHAPRTAPTAASPSAPPIVAHRAKPASPATPATVTPRATPAATPAPVAVPIGVAAQVVVPPASDPDFEPMFDIAAPMVITALMTRTVATAALRMQALRNQKAGAVMADYVAYAIARLDNLTPADAYGLGLTADDLYRWQQFFRG